MYETNHDYHNPDYLPIAEGAAGVSGEETMNKSKVLYIQFDAVLKRVYSTIGDIQNISKPVITIVRHIGNEVSTRIYTNVTMSSQKRMRVIQDELEARYQNRREP